MKRQILSSLGLLAVVGVAACGQGGALSGPASEDSAAASAVADAAAGSYSYEVRLVLSAQAADVLAAAGEQVTISSSYYGLARKGSSAAKAAEAQGEVTLAQDRLDVAPTDQLLRIASPFIAPASLKDVEGEPMLLINVFTARNTSSDNLIDCGIYDGSLAVATVRPILIECGLIESGATTAIAAP